MLQMSSMGHFARECNVKTVDDKARYSAFKVTEVKTDEPKALVSVDSMVNWSDHAAENKTSELEKNLLRRRLKPLLLKVVKAGDDAMQFLPPSLELIAHPIQTQRPYASCDSSLKDQDKDFPPCCDIKSPPFLFICRESNVKTQISTAGSPNSVPCKSKAAYVLTGSRNSSASVTAGGSDPAASRKDPAALFLAGRPVFCGWFNPAARPNFSHHLYILDNMYGLNLYDPSMNEGHGVLLLSLSSVKGERHCPNLDELEMVRFRKSTIRKSMA
ncbi:hypothetical protein Tco_0589974 [Tanacetum coccineum]